jgi:hypothetical protein
MVNSRRMLLIGVIVIGVIFVGVVATLLAGVGGDPYKKTCDTFIGHIMKQEATRSYGMLSADARQTDSAQAWSEKVVSLEYLYKGGELQFDEKVDPTDSNDPEAQKTKTNRYELTYTIVHPVATSAIKCTVVNSGDAYVVDGFSSAEKVSSQSETQ